MKKLISYTFISILVAGCAIATPDYSYVKKDNDPQIEFTSDSQLMGSTLFSIFHNKNGNLAAVINKNSELVTVDIPADKPMILEVIHYSNHSSCGPLKAIIIPKKNKIYLAKLNWVDNNKETTVAIAKVNRNGCKLTIIDNDTKSSVLYQPNK